MGISQTLKALADPVRRGILEMLKHGPKSAGEIAQAFELTPATVSYHLSQLKKAGLLIEEKQKNFIYYSLDVTVFEEILVWFQSLGGGNENEKKSFTRIRMGTWRHALASFICHLGLSKITRKFSYSL